MLAGSGSMEEREGKVDAPPDIPLVELELKQPKEVLAGLPRLDSEQLGPLAMCWCTPHTGCSP